MDKQWLNGLFTVRISFNGATRYFICHFASDVNELLQAMHDAAEDRVMRGLHIDECEVSAIWVSYR